MPQLWASRQQQKAAVQAREDAGFLAMLRHKAGERLAGEAKRAVRLVGNQFVWLVWDHVWLELRTADLLALDLLLQKAVAEIDLDHAETYMLWLNDDPLHLSRAGLRQLCTMVHMAASRLPRRVLHWIDLSVRLEPHQPFMHNGLTRYSQN